jgi:hypothetical protein
VTRQDRPPFTVEKTGRAPRRRVANQARPAPRWSAETRQVPLARERELAGQGVGHAGGRLHPPGPAAVGGGQDAELAADRSDSARPCRRSRNVTQS